MLLDAYLKAKRLSQADMAAMAGVSQNTISRAARPLPIPAKTAKRISAATGGAVSVATLTCGRRVLDLSGTPAGAEAPLRAILRMLRGEQVETGEHPITVPATG